MNDSQLQAQAYSYFLAEAPELLQTIEQEILTLPNEHTTTKVHNLMRALHTLKGAAANVGLTTIERIAHDFEDVARVFYDLEVKIDVSIQTLLLDGYSGLQECLEAQLIDREIDEQTIVDRLAATIDQLKSILGDWTETDTALPTAIELGFDIVASIFETTIQEQIDVLSAVIANKDLHEIENYLHSATEICIGLAESFELPGFLAINQAIIAAISLNPDRLESIAPIALENLRQAQAAVLAGDRATGGHVHPDLVELTQVQSAESSIPQPTESVKELEIDPDPAEFSELVANWTVETPETVGIESGKILTTAIGEGELPAFRAFLTSGRFRTRNELSLETQNLFDRILQLCWDWFRHQIQTPHSQLNLELLVAAEGLADLDYLHHWIGLLLQKVGAPNDRPSLRLYRKSCIYQVIFAVAKYIAESSPRAQITPEFLSELRSYLQTTVIEYKQQPPVTINERGWLDRIILPHHWSGSAIITPEDPLIDEIWGQPQITSGSLSSVNSHFNSEIALEFTEDCQQQLVQLDRLQSVLIESHHQSIQHHQQLQDTCSATNSSELANLIVNSDRLAQNLTIALETASQLYQVADRQQQFLRQIAAG